MSQRDDKPHVLVITDPRDGLEKEWRVVHPPTCPWDAFRYDPRAFDFVGELHDETAPRWHFHRVCLTQWEVDANGIDGVAIETLDVGDHAHIDPSHVRATEFEAEWHRLRPGRYTFVSWYTPGGWAGDYYDADAGMYLTSWTPAVPS